LQATAQIVKEQAEFVAQAASNRVATARAGKKLLDEGGETAAEAVLAKQAAIDASDLDRRIAAHVDRAILTLDDSVEKLRSADTVQKPLDTADDHDLPRVIAEHAERATVFRQIAQMLEKPASCAEMSAEESDAVTIVQAREGCATALSKTSVGLDSVKQRALASFSSGTTSASASNQSSSPPEASAAVSQAPTLLEGMRANAVVGVQMVKQAASERIDTVKAGKSLLDNGGDAIAQLVVAKKATLQAATIDRNVAQRMDSAIAKFDASATKLRVLLQAQQTCNILSHEDALRLAGEHEVRVQMFREIAEWLKKPISSLSMNLAELDAHSFVRMRQNCGILQSRTNEGFEAAKNLAYTSCASDIDGESRTRRMRSVCA
jgi:hypothetical protein